MNGSSGFSFVILALVLVFFIFRRARALTSRQKVRPTAMGIRLAIFAVLGGLVLVLSAGSPFTLLAELAGLAAGGLVAWFGVRHSVFEHLPDGLYVTPNRYIGLAVFALFLLRLLYRFALSAGTPGTTALLTPGGTPTSPLAQFSSDPLTSGVYFLLIGYYGFTYTTLILRARQPVAVP